MTDLIVNGFVEIVKKDSEIDSIQRLILIFYNEEVGGSIDMYNTSIIVSDNNTVKSSSYKNRKRIKTKYSNSFNSKEFYRFISSIEEEVKGNNSNLFLIDINKTDTKCNIYYDIKFEKSKEIKELDFINW